MAATGTASGGDSFLDIRVGEPQTQGDGRAPYTTYKIVSSQRGIERFEQSTFEVVRRYSDFDWLRKRLLMVAPTVAVPPLPPKDGLPVKNFHDEFIESRNRGLQRFVDRIASHPRLRVAEPVFQFLTLEDTGFTAVKDATRPKMTESMQRGVFSMMSAAGSAIGSAVDRVRGAPSDPATRTAADLSFEELSTYINGVHAALVRAEKAAGSMLTKRLEAAGRMLEYWKGYETLGNHEKEDLGASFSKIGSTMHNQGKMEAMLASGELRWFREDLRDAIAVAEAAQAAFRYREAVSASLQASKERLEAKRVAQDRVRGDPTKGPAADAEVAKAVSAVDEAREAFVTANNELLDEVAQLRGMRLADSKQMLLDFAVMEAMRAEAAENLWSRIVASSAEAATAEEGKVEAWRRAGGDTKQAAAAVRVASEADASAAAAAASSGGTSGPAGGSYSAAAAAAPGGDAEEESPAI
ncbi:hypothetical protein FNF27_04981 [Cafeteria roenbergensis]|uniref:PX domain-containing protein n=1 Tax=Cafeteria roenbergensis TaxID=33653 RepID=A0A5A8CW32_CAFRO|nr:hypothetical protein FNF29_00608 [Cafeteria roenbergensis]KAA0161917.1 hypothetical protein FNF31_03494 [Cafeteria roenbergensis]KAA0168335.1 hypothetical protein FNF28_02495 [Cafeteria roenbergensis]KAA0173486.1 hypothetical protein FNF27_04981 [Cafeteria roenbergensis]|eukprot:KAA0157256.1 hypothetical protein FNF29_00608 [Cafeteria roenbergensis]